MHMTSPKQDPTRMASARPGEGPAEVSELLLQLPRPMRIGRHRLELHPATLAHTHMCAPLVAALHLAPAKGINPYLATLAAATTHKHETSRIIALHTLTGRRELTDERLIRRRTALIERTTTAADRATLLTIILTAEADLAAIMHESGIEEEARHIAAIGRIKEQSPEAAMLTLGGRTIYGRIIDTAAHRYGWTLEYILYDISHANLRLLMADTIQSIHITPEERKKLPPTLRRRTAHGREIDLGTPEGQAALAKIINQQ